MQKLGLDIIRTIKREKMRKIETELSMETVGGFVECPFCHYVTEKTKRFSGKIFQDGNGKAFKCFACGIWRRL